MERSGAGRRIDLSGRDPKNHDQSSYFKSIKGQSLEFNIAAALGLELHQPIMSKLWGLGDQTYRQTEKIYNVVVFRGIRITTIKLIIEFQGTNDQIYPGCI